MGRGFDSKRGGLVGEAAERVREATEMGIRVRVLVEEEMDILMNCLQFLPRSSALPLQSFKAYARKSSSSVSTLGVMNASDLPPIVIVKAVSGSTSSTEMSNANVDEEKSEIYSNTMTEAMGAGKFIHATGLQTLKDVTVPDDKALGNQIPMIELSLTGCHLLSPNTFLTYRHELGMNYNFIRPDLIVGSCLQTPEDVDKLRNVGVKTIFCLQQDPDLEYFGVDITAIREYANTYDDIQHLRAAIRDFDGFDLRMRLPAVVSKLHKAINQNGGVTYIHCTAGLGRAPAVALAYMFWVQGYKLSEGNSVLLSKRPSFPKLDAIKSATADIVIYVILLFLKFSFLPLFFKKMEISRVGLRKKLVTLTWKGSDCSTVEVSGLDIGWGQRTPMKFDKEQGLWILQRELPEGCYEYKYIVDGEWTYNSSELVTPVSKDGHVNNYVQVSDDDPNSITATLQKRFMGDNCNLMKDERLKIRKFLEAFPEEE
ncbi:hypothetical protein TEA_004450 [Camellia sinensis var. sinensis]|uniref:Dual specificity protein phosphatase 4 n=1 Tax=Camellia sinensis var. sinensis TaxID=542762 RepID=A0A4S4CX14_CAMSN|nr:hypothetical protein TEA_004450 [Camellia sinensis var. sinensis]